MAFRSLLLTLLSCGGYFHLSLAQHDPPPCNSVITTITIEDIQKILDPLFDFSFDSDISDADRARLNEIYNTPLKYDVLVSKACGSCDDIVDSLTALDPTDSRLWAEYCGSDVYGFDSTHSTLVMLPIDPDTNKPLSMTLTGLLNFQGQRLTVTEAYTTDFPTHIKQRFLETTDDFERYYYSFVDSYPLLVAASSGRVAIGPDYMGTGESIDLDRSFLTKMPIEQAAVVSLYAAAAYTSSVTNGCTQLSFDHLVVSGYSQGGLSALIAASVLKNTAGANIQQVFSMAGPYALGLLVQYDIFLKTLAPGIPIDLFASSTASYILASWSNNSPFLGVDIPMGSAEYLNASNPEKNMLDWFFISRLDQAALYEVVPTTNTESLASINSILQGPAFQASAGGGYMCEEPYVTDDMIALCAAIEANQGLNLIPFVDFPMQTCHGEEDALIPYALSTELIYLFGNPNIQPFIPDVELFGELDFHNTSITKCFSGVFQYIQENTPTIESITLDADGAKCVVYPSCNICGDDSLSMTRPEGLLLFPGDDEPISCANYAQSGLDGDIAPALCANMPMEIADACGCMVTSAPSVAPTATPTKSPTGGKGKGGKGSKGKMRHRSLKKKGGDTSTNSITQVVTLKNSKK